MNIFLASIQIILSLVLMGAILIQHSESGLGTSFGGGDSMNIGHTRRGAEKIIFRGTIILAIAFVVVSFIAFIIS
jgi:protein translocase SecG subunit